MDIDTWVSLAVLIAALTGMYWALRREIKDTRTELNTKIDALRTEVKDEVRERHAELKEDIRDVKAEVREVKGSVAVLEGRVYELGVGLKHHIEQARTTGS